MQLNRFVHMRFSVAFARGKNLGSDAGYPSEAMAFTSSSRLCHAPFMKLCVCSWIEALVKHVCVMSACVFRDKQRERESPLRNFAFGILA